MRDTETGGRGWNEQCRFFHFKTTCTGFDSEGSLWLRLVVKANYCSGGMEVNAWIREATLSNKGGFGCRHEKINQKTLQSKI